MKKISSCIAICLFLQACGPKPEAFNPQLGESIDSSLFGPRLKDTNITFSQQAQSLSSKKSLLNYSDDVASSEVFHLSKTLFDLSKIKKQNELADLARKITNGFLSSSNTVSKRTLTDSHVMNAILAQIETGFTEALNDLDGQADLVIDLLVGVADKYSLSDKSRLAQDIMDLLNEANDVILADPELVPDVKTAVSEILVEYIDITLPPVIDDYAILLASNNPTQIVNLIEVNLDRFDYQLEGSTAQKINDVKPVASAINAINGDAQRALTAIVLLWEFSDSSQRQQFRDVSADLYDQLADADFETLTCWKRNDFCWDMGFGIWVIEKVRKKILYQELEDFGISSIQSSLAEQVSDGVRSEVYALVDDFKADLEGLFDGLVRDEFDAKVIELQDTVNGIATKLRPEIETFGTAELASSQISAYETDTVKLTLAGSDSISAQALGSIDSASSSAAVFGKGLSAQSRKWLRYQSEYLGATDKAPHRQEILTSLEKIFSMGGYTGVGEKVESGLSKAVPNPQANSYDLNNLSGLKYSYAIPNSFSATGESTGSRDINIGHQAAVLNGLVDMMNFLQDWSTNSFDDALGEITIEPILTTELKDIAGDEVNTKMFPKDQMFALTVGQIAIMLQGLELNGSPLVLMDGERFQFVSNPDSFDQIDTIAVAATGRLNGRRDFRVNVRDLADLLIALVDVSRAIENLSNTRSETLRDTSGGQSPLQQLQEARSGSIKSLILGIANFLASKTQNSRGAVAEEVDLNGSKMIDNGKTVRTQVRVIRALVRASEELNSPVYTWAAQDAYFFLNAEAWETGTDFYRLSDSVDIFQVTDTILALSELKPTLSVKSQGQLDVIMGRWLESLRSY